MGARSSHGLGAGVLLAGGVITSSSAPRCTSSPNARSVGLLVVASIPDRRATSGENDRSGMANGSLTGWHPISPMAETIGVDRTSAAVIFTTSLIGA